MSPNNNEAQVYNKQGDGWNLIQSLAEVRYIRITDEQNGDLALTWPTARQAHHGHLVGAADEPNRHLLAGPKRLCLDTDRERLEARSGPAANQQGCDLCQVESKGRQVCRRQWCEVSFAILQTQAVQPS